MQEPLPQPNGTDELAGKTYERTNSNLEYVFGNDKTYILQQPQSNPSEYETGPYSYDSTQKRVYFRIVKYHSKTAVEYYETVTESDYYPNHFETLDAYKAAYTNYYFRSYTYQYDPTQKLINFKD